MRAVLVSAAATSVGFYLLLSAVPVYASGSAGGAVAAGLASAALMLSSVASEVATPRLVARFGYRAVFGAGVVLLGVPALLLPISVALPFVVAISILRGFGFGITVVVGAALAARIAPAERRGESLGLYGVVSTVPAVVALPLGVWLVGEIGVGPVFALGGLSSVSMVAVLRWLPPSGGEVERPLGVAGLLRRIDIARPAAAFASTALACGIVVTFLPLAVADGSRQVVAVAFLAQTVAATVTRWWTGRLIDRSGSARLLVRGLLAAVAGIALLVVSGPAMVVGGMALFGIGFGAVQAVSLTAMLERVSTADYSAASAIWNVAYDGGWGVGSVAFGLVAALAGYPVAFVLTAGVVGAALMPAWLDGEAERRIKASGGIRTCNTAS